MSFWALVQIFIDMVLLTTCGFLWVKLNRPQKDDPRMSRGLQLLGSKISVLEDLSDRTETQVKQLTSLMEQKVREIQSTLQEAESQVQKIEQSMTKSLEVAKIFQDKIPHQEIIERQNTIKYVKAARMAHQGASVEEILQAVDLPRGEIEFIAKVNRDQLQFSEEDLPAWAKGESAESEGPVSVAKLRPSPILSAGVAVSRAVEQKQENIYRESSPQLAPTPTQEVLSPSPTLQGLGEKFRQAMSQNVVPQTILEPRSDLGSRDTNAKDNLVKKVIFPKIDY